MGIDGQYFLLVKMNFGDDESQGTKRGQIYFLRREVLEKMN